MSTDLPIQMFDLPRGRKHNTPIARSASFKEPQPPVVARMPQELINLLEKSAKASFRSRSAEMTFRLWTSFENQSIDEHGVIVVHSPSPIK